MDGLNMRCGIYFGHACELCVHPVPPAFIQYQPSGKLLHCVVFNIFSDLESE